MSDHRISTKGVRDKLTVPKQRRLENNKTNYITGTESLRAEIVLRELPHRTTEAQTHAHTATNGAGRAARSLYKSSKSFLLYAQTTASGAAVCCAQPKQVLLARSTGNFPLHGGRGKFRSTTINVTAEASV